MNANASVGRRIGGGLVDLVITFVLIMVIGFITGFGTTSEGGGAGVHVAGGPFLGIALVVFVVFAVMEAQIGKTPGKMLLRTRVVDPDGNRITFVAALIRNVFRFIDGIAFYIVGLIVMAIDKENRRLGDMVARTRVVNDAAGGD